MVFLCPLGRTKLRKPGELVACNFFNTAGRAALVLVLTAAACVQAQQPAARFDVDGFAVQGAPMLKSEDFSRVVAPFIGRQRTAADLRKARQALQQAYIDLGYCEVEVFLPNAEAVARMVALRLARLATAISKDCLPTVVHDKGAVPVPAVPGVAAIKPSEGAARVVAVALRTTAAPANRLLP